MTQSPDAQTNYYYSNLPKVPPRTVVALFYFPKVGKSNNDRGSKYTTVPSR